jgi:hypothetical protein
MKKLTTIVLMLIWVNVAFSQTLEKKDKESNSGFYIQKKLIETPDGLQVVNNKNKERHFLFLEHDTEENLTNQIEETEKEIEENQNDIDVSEQLNKKLDSLKAKRNYLINKK